MNAIVTGVSELKPGKNKKYLWRQIDLTLENGKISQTYVCPTFRNYSNWREVVLRGVGTRVSGLQMLDNFRVNADSAIKVVL